MATSAELLLNAGNGQSCLDHSIGIEADGVDAFLDQELRELWIVTRGLSADSDLATALLRGPNGQAHHLQYCWVTFIKELGHQSGIPVQAQGELGEVIG